MTQINGDDPPKKKKEKKEREREQRKKMKNMISEFVLETFDLVCFYFFGILVG